MTNKEKMYLVSEEELRNLKYRSATIPNSRKIEEEFKGFLKSKTPVEVIASGRIIDFIQNKDLFAFKYLYKSGTLIFVEDKEIK